IEVAFHVLVERACGGGRERHREHDRDGSPDGDVAGRDREARERGGADRDADAQPEEIEDEAPAGQGPRRTGGSGSRGAHRGSPRTGARSRAADGGTHPPRADAGRVVRTSATRWTGTSS